MNPLKPIMALLVAASCGFAAAKASGGGESDAISALSGLIEKNPQARKEVGERLARFVTAKTSQGGRYLTPGLLSDKALLPSVSAAAEAWAEKNKDPRQAAVLYFVIGLDGPLPGWAKASPLLAKTLPRKDKRLGERLSEALASARWTGAQRIAQSGAAEATAAFLNDAAKRAQTVLDYQGSKPQIRTRIAADDKTAVTPPTEGKPPSGKPPTLPRGKDSDFQALYVTGAKTGPVQGPGDKGALVLSIKVHTRTGADGSLINGLQIVDITPGLANDQHPVFVDWSRPGEHDVTLHEGGRHYTVTVASDGGVALKRAGAKDGDGGSSIQATRVELSLARDAQIMRSASVMIGGHAYKQLRQGGATESRVFFREDQLLAAPGCDAHADLMGDVARVLSDGSTRPIGGKPDLGRLADGSPWHLECRDRACRVVAGEGDKKNKNGGLTEGSHQKAGVTTLDQAVKLLQNKKGKPAWSEDPGNSGFDAATRSKVRIMSGKFGGALQFDVVFDPSFGVPDNQWQTARGKSRPLHVRGVGRYVALEFAAQTLYYDVENLARLGKGANAEPAGAATGDGGMHNVRSADIAEDILLHLRTSPVKKDDPRLAALRELVRKNAHGDYLIEGDSRKKIILRCGEARTTIWPK